MKKKIGIVLSLCLIAFTLIYFNGEKTKTKNLAKNVPEETVEKEIAVIEKTPTDTEQPVEEPSPPSWEERSAETAKKVEKEFDSLVLPINFPEHKMDKYVVADRYYYKTSFFLNEVAGGTLNPSRQDLKKAFKVIVATKEYMPNDGQLGDVLKMVEEDHGAIFNQALRELSKSEEDLILDLMKDEY